MNSGARNGQQIEVRRERAKKLLDGDSGDATQMVRQELDDQRGRARQNSLHAQERKILGSFNVHEYQVELTPLQQIVETYAGDLDDLRVVVKIRVISHLGHAF
jgi:hypothetical protein